MVGDTVRADLPFWENREGVLLAWPWMSWDCLVCLPPPKSCLLPCLVPGSLSAPFRAVSPWCSEELVPPLGLPLPATLILAAAEASVPMVYLVPPDSVHINTHGMGWGMGTLAAHLPPGLGTLSATVMAVALASESLSRSL